MFYYGSVTDVNQLIIALSSESFSIRSYTKHANASVYLQRLPLHYCV